MSNFAGELEHIKTLMSSTQKSEKPFAYSSMLHLQQQLNGGGSFIQPLLESSHDLFSLIISDVEDEDEEVMVLTLKSLEFFIYHPTLDALTPVGSASVIVVYLLLDSS